MSAVLRGAQRLKFALRPTVRTLTQGKRFLSDSTPNADDFAKRRLEKRKLSGDIRTDFLMSAPININMIEDTVAFKNIDKKGGSKRFYRQVFIEPSEENPNVYNLYLDSRILLLKGNRAMSIPSYNVALAVASEFESQAEYIRLDSMPLTDLEVKRNLMEDSEVRSRRRRGIIETLEHIVTEDLLTIAESKERRDEGFYENRWEPVIHWFNEKFQTDFQITYANMSTPDPNNQTFFEELLSKEPEEVIQEFEGFMQKIRDDKTKNYSSIINPASNLGSYRAWIRKQSDLKLMVMDELLGYFPSTILITAVAEHGFDVDFFFEAIDCPELDTQVLSLYKENLKLAESRLILSAVKCYLSFYALDDSEKLHEYSAPNSGKAFRNEYFGPFARLIRQEEKKLRENIGEEQERTGKPEGILEVFGKKKIQDS